MQLLTHNMDNSGSRCTHSFDLRSYAKSSLDFGVGIQLTQDSANLVVVRPPTPPAHTHFFLFWNMAVGRFSLDDEFFCVFFFSFLLILTYADSFQVLKSYLFPTGLACYFFISFLPFIICIRSTKGCLFSLHIARGGGFFTGVMVVSKQRCPVESSCQ